MEWVGKPVTTQVYLTATVMNLNKLAATRLIVDAFLAVEGAFDALRRQFQSDEAPSVHADAA